MQKENIAEQGYNVMVTGRHVHVTEGMKDHAIHQISKLDHLGNRIIDVNVTMDIQKLDHKCDIMMKYGNTLIRSHAITSDMYASIDQAVGKLNRQLRKYKRRLNEHHAKKHPIEELPVTIYAAPEYAEEHHEETEQHTVVSQDSEKLKILSLDEAIMKMELSERQFLVFRDEDSRQLKIIHRREDNNYGIVTLEA